MREFKFCVECEKLFKEKIGRSMWYRCLLTNEGFRQKEDYIKANKPKSCSKK